MSHWWDLIMDARGITAIYGGAPPALDDVVVHEITLHRDGPSVRLRIDLPSYPDPAPPKWRAQGYNVVQVVLTMVGVRDVALRGWSHQIRAGLALAREEGVVAVRMTSDAVRLDLRADAVDLTAVSAYRQPSGVPR
ncbi:Imm50 family immunity protein [Plantactinospora sp. WMMC1484]|uniref:Imm50 family immunity protein n=1 Tax=Plantactinospora sp. WMMC1484 TaxID=3404122 RepID=UPI003BF59F6F